MLPSRSKGHAFIYLILIRWDAQILLRISKLFKQQSSSVRNGLKDPYLEIVNLSFIFTWDYGKIEDRTKVSTSPLFEGLLINNTKLRDILTRIKCMAMLLWLEIKWQIYESEDTYDMRLLENFSLL